VARIFLTTVRPCACRQLLSLADVLAAVPQGMSAAWSAGAGVRLLEGGCAALMACGSLAMLLRLPAADMQRLAEAGRFVFELGRDLMLALQLTTPEQELAMQRLGTSLSEGVVHLAARQLLAVMMLVSALMAHEGCLEDFARGAAKPSALVPWLAALAGALQLGQEAHGAGSHNDSESECTEYSCSRCVRWWVGGCQ